MNRPVKNTLFGCALVLVVAGIHSCAHAEDVASGNFQLPGCRQLVFGQISGETAFRAGWCIGAVAAIADGNPAICLPPGVTPEQSAKVVIAYLDANPAKLNENFYRLAAVALTAAWPCKRRP